MGSITGDSDELEFQRFRARLPGFARQAVDKIQLTTFIFQRELISPQWCVCEQPEGDFPRIRLFDNEIKLVRYLASLEGKEVSVWALWGVPLYLTKPTGGIRYLFLPGGKKALPLQTKGPLLPVDASLLQGVAEYQYDGWLGPSCLAEGVNAEYYIGNEEAK